MKRKQSETGRSLLETLSVLVVIALLLLASILGYDVLVKKYKKDQTVKAVSELAVRYKLHPVSKPGNVNIKTIYPEAERADAITMKTMDTSSGRVQLEASEEASYFMLLVNQVLDDSCEAILEKGEYDAVLGISDNQTPTAKKEDEKQYVAVGQKLLKDLLKDMDFEKLSDAEKEILKKAGIDSTDTKDGIISKLCVGGGLKKAALVFGDHCPSVGASYWYNGRCWACASDREQDMYGNCCFKGKVDVCGVCPGKCPNGGVCDTSTKVCVECIDEDQCEGRLDGKTKCDRSAHKCVACKQDSDCPQDAIPQYCTKRHTCEPCNTADPVQHLRWNREMDICECKTPLIALGGSCSNECCVNGTICRDKDSTGVGTCKECSSDYNSADPNEQGSCPSDRPICNVGKCEGCAAVPEAEGATCNPLCGCDASRGLSCVDGSCQCSTDYYWDETESKCKKGCRWNDNLYHVNQPVNQCGICNEGGLITPGVDSNCCDQNTWELKPEGTWVSECGACSSVGSVVTRADISPSCCHNGVPDWFLKWRGSEKTRECGADCCLPAESCVQNQTTGTLTCCPNAGANGDPCTIDNCCQTGSCSIPAGATEGYCCQPGQIWNGTACAAACSDWDENSCRVLHNMQAVDPAYAQWNGGDAACCDTLLDSVEGVAFKGYTCSGELKGCCRNDLVSNGHCCPEGQTWNGSTCVTPCSDWNENGCRVLHNMQAVDPAYAQWNGGDAACCDTVIDFVENVAFTGTDCSGQVKGCCRNDLVSNGHCCPEGQTWNGFACVAACFDWDENSCHVLHNMQAVDPAYAQWNGGDAACCDTLLDSVEGVAFKGYTCSGELKGCCRNDLVSNGHCCPAGQTWNGSTCAEAGPCGGTTTDVGCGCGIALTAEGCCPGQVKDINGTCCNEEAKGCDGICNSGKKMTNCGCGGTCKKCFVTDKPEGTCTGPCQSCCMVGPGKHGCTYGAGMTGRRYTASGVADSNGSKICYNHYKKVGNKEVLKHYGLYDCWKRTTKNGNYVFKNLRTKETKTISKDSGRKYTKIGTTCYLDPDKNWN